MAGLRRFVRGAGLALAGCVSLVSGLVLAERLVRPTVLDQIETPALFGLVMLLALPALTYGALRQDLKAVARARDLAAPRGEFETGVSGPSARLVRHGAHEREHAAVRRPKTAKAALAAE